MPLIPQLIASRRRGRSSIGMAMALALAITIGTIAFVPSPSSAAQDGDYTYTVMGVPAVATITGYTGVGGAITIPSSLGGYPTAHIGIDAFDYIDTITSVIMPNSLISIDDQAFQYCTSLTSVVIGSNVTTIKNHAFDHCTSLASVTIPDNVTAIGDSAFAYCSNLTSVFIGSHVASIGMASFYSCTKLTSIAFYGLTVPNYVGAYWIQNANPGIRGHAYASSNFPSPGGVFNGLTMGATIDDGTTIPGAPIDLVATSGDNSVALAWTAPVNDGGNLITNYKVYRGNASQGETLLATLGALLTYLDSSVVNGQRYYYKVSAMNSKGEGALSNEVDALPVGLPSAPQNLLGSPGDGFVNLTWSAPISDGGSVITNYQIWRGTASGMETFLSISNLIPWFNDTGLTNGNIYYYTVRAENAQGLGPNSSEVSVIPSQAPTVPSAPQGLVATPGDTYVNLSWSIPGSDGGSAITNYQVWRGATAGSETFHMNVGLDLWYNDTGLINGQTYFYFIKAENAQGTGPGSNEVSVSPVHAATEPSAPQGLVATPRNGEIMLNWSVPANDGGSPVIGYNVYRGPTSGGETLIALLGNVLAHNDSGLTNGQTYFYVIRAENAVGEGGPSNEASAMPTLGDTVPTAPTGLTATSGETNVYLNWTPPSYVGPGTIHYHLFRDGATLWSGTAIEYNDTAVLGSITYSYTVAAENDLGWGLNSTEVSATPSGPGSVPPGAPTGLTVDAGDGQVVLTWQAPIDPGSASISSYNVYRGTQSSSFTLVASINDTTYSDNNVTNGQQYHYQVSAVSMAGESDLTPEVTATPESSGSNNGINTTLVIVIIAIVAVGILGALWYVRKK